MKYFDSWSSLGNTALAGVAGYVVLVLLLRISGKRTLAKLNAFDLIVTVALGSTLASVITSQQLPLANGLLALILLVALQFIVAWLNVRAGWFRRLVKSEPVLVFYEGAFLDSALRSSRLTRDELLAVVRGSGTESLGGVGAVVLETDGSISVIPRARGGEDASSLSDVRFPEHVAAQRTGDGEAPARRNE